MIKPHYLFAVVVFSIAGTVVDADPVDPVMSMDDPGVGLPVGLGFSFLSNGSGGGFLAFNNATSLTWSTLDIYVTLPTNSPITCISGPFFESCVTTSVSEGGGNSLYDIQFNNRVIGTTAAVQPQQLTGILPGAYFTLNLNDFINGVQPVDPNGSGGWGANKSFNAVANGAPEPASWLLVAGGIGIFWGVLRRVRRNTA